MYKAYYSSANYLVKTKFQQTKIKFSNYEKGKPKYSKTLQYVSQKTIPFKKDSVVKGTICCETYSIN